MTTTCQIDPAGGTVPRGARRRVPTDAPPPADDPPGSVMALSPTGIAALARQKETERIEKLRRRRARAKPPPVPSRMSGVTIHRVPTRSASWVAADGRTVLATARRFKSAGVPVTWLLRVPGYQWEVTPDMPASRIWKIGGLIPTKGFPSWQACDREVARVLRELNR